MAEHLYEQPDLTKQVTFQTSEKNKNAVINDDIDRVMIYENSRSESSTWKKSQDRTAEAQQQRINGSVSTSVSVNSGKRNFLRVAAVFLGLLVLVLLAAVFVLLVLLILDKTNWNMERNQLCSERDKLQTSFSEMKILNHNLTQKTSQLESEKNDLMAVNNNLTKERDELQKQIETTCCPAKWTAFQNSCYFTSTSKKSWTDSRNICETFGAQLVIISNDLEQRFISLLKRPVWIGLTDEETEGEYRWVNGEEVTKKYWIPGEPTTGRRENCVEIVNYRPAPKNWNDKPCSIPLNFICEKNRQ